MLRIASSGTSRTTRHRPSAIGTTNPPDGVEMMRRVSLEPGYPLRIVSLLRMQKLTGKALVDRALELRPMSTERLRLGIIKVVADGSIQSFSARLRWPCTTGP